MSEIYIVWAEDANKVQAKLEQIADGEIYRVLRRGNFPLIQVEDLDKDRFLSSENERYCVVVEVG